MNKPAILSDDEITEAIGMEFGGGVIACGLLDKLRHIAKCQYDDLAAYYEPLVQQAKERYSTGVKDNKGIEIKKGDTIRWMACCGDCFKGIVDFRVNDDERIPFLSGFLVCKVVNITDDVMNEEGELIGGWNGSLEIIGG